MPLPPCTAGAGEEWLSPHPSSVAVRATDPSSTASLLGMVVSPSLAACGLVRPRQHGQRGTLAPLTDVLLELAAELLNRVLHRPARPVGQAADRRPRHDADVLGHLVQDLQVLHPPVSAAD